eukprot:scaffold14_cov279-Pinguiococcus_pyrenoidosus.AAC.4
MMREKLGHSYRRVAKATPQKTPATGREARRTAAERQDPYEEALWRGPPVDQVGSAHVLAGRMMASWSRGA